MINHVHLLVTPRREGGISATMQYLGRYFNLTCQRTGTLWEGRFHSCLVESERYLLACQRYIELNPVRAGMVTDPADYKWSSYRATGMGIESRLITCHPLYISYGKSKLERIKNYRDTFASETDEALLSAIRYATNKGLTLGTEKFKPEVETLTGQRIHPKKRGPKSRRR